MKKKEQLRYDRRNFLKNLARGGLLAACGFIGGKLLTRGHLPSQDCINRFICRSCRVVPECCLPQALSFRAARQPGVTKMRNQGADNE